MYTAMYTSEAIPEDTVRHNRLLPKDLPNGRTFSVELQNFPSIALHSEPDYFFISSY